MPPAYEVLLLNTAVPQIQAAQAGDTYVVPRDIAFSAALTLSAGTANGVPYLNGSKVLTTGSALTFDGSQFAVNASSSGIPLVVNGTGNTGLRVVGGTGAGIGSYLSLQAQGGNAALIGTEAAITGSGTSTNLMLYGYGSSSIIFAPATSEQMRLTSTGLGIGTSSPGYKLDVNGIARSDSWIGRSSGSAPTADCAVFRPADNSIGFSTANTERARITSGGNLLVGTQSGSGARMDIVAAASTNALNIQVQTFDYFGASIHSTATSNDNSFIAFATEASFTTRGTITYNRAGGLTAYNTTSDYRAKDIIGQVQNPGATIDALKVYEGKMKGATQSRPMLIAHEAQEHAPYAVSGTKDEVNEDGTPKFQQMDVSSLVPLLLAEIQSLRARVAQLEGN